MLQQQPDDLNKPTKICNHQSTVPPCILCIKYYDKPELALVISKVQEKIIMYPCITNTYIMISRQVNISSIFYQEPHSCSLSVSTSNIKWRLACLSGA